MSSAATWGNNSANHFNGFTNQGFPLEQNASRVWQTRDPTAGAPTAGAPTAGAPTAGAPTAGAPTGGITVVVNATHWRSLKTTLKRIGVIQMIFGVVFLVFTIVFLVIAPVPLVVGVLIFNCMTHFVAGALSIALPMNNPSSCLVKNSQWISVVSVAATAILIIVLIVSLVQHKGFEDCISMWNPNCMDVKRDMIRGFLMVFSVFAAFSSIGFLGYKFKGCCPGLTESVVTVPPTQAAGSLFQQSTLFQGYAGQQEYVASAPPIQAASSTMPTAFQGYSGQQILFDNSYSSVNVNNTTSDDPPSYDECVFKDQQQTSKKF